MNDNEIKKLLESDHSEPKVPKDEWSKIEREISPAKPSWILSLGGTFAVCLVLVLFNNKFKSPSLSLSFQERENVVSYLFDNVGFEEVEEGSLEEEPLSL